MEADRARVSDSSFQSLDLAGTGRRPEVAICVQDIFFRILFSFVVVSVASFFTLSAFASELCQDIHQGFPEFEQGESLEVQKHSAERNPNESAEWNRKVDSWLRSTYRQLKAPGPSFFGIAPAGSSGRLATTRMTEAQVLALHYISGGEIAAPHEFDISGIQTESRRVEVVGPFGRVHKIVPDSPANLNSSWASDPSRFAQLSADASTGYWTQRRGSSFDNYSRSAYLVVDWLNRLSAQDNPWIRILIPHHIRGTEYRLPFRSELQALLNASGLPLLPSSDLFPRSGLGTRKIYSVGSLPSRVPVTTLGAEQSSEFFGVLGIRDLTSDIVRGPSAERLSRQSESDFDPFLFGPRARKLTFGYDTFEPPTFYVGRTKLRLRVDELERFIPAEFVTDPGVGLRLAADAPTTGWKPYRPRVLRIFDFRPKQPEFWNIDREKELKAAFSLLARADFEFNSEQASAVKLGILKGFLPKIFAANFKAFVPKGLLEIALPDAMIGIERNRGRTNVMFKGPDVIPSPFAKSDPRLHPRSEKLLRDLFQIENSWTGNFDRRVLIFVILSSISNGRQLESLGSNSVKLTGGEVGELIYAAEVISSMAWLLGQPSEVYPRMGYATNQIEQLLFLKKLALYYHTSWMISVVMVDFPDAFQFRFLELIRWHLQEENPGREIRKEDALETIRQLVHLDPK